VHKAAPAARYVARSIAAGARRLGGLEWMIVVTLRMAWTFREPLPFAEAVHFVVENISHFGSRLSAISKWGDQAQCTNTT
jgi:hypothetical protein